METLVMLLVVALMAASALLFLVSVEAIARMEDL